MEYREIPKLRQLVAEIPWGQNLLIMSKVKDIDARTYYLQANKECAWTRDVLRLQLNSQA